jgi:MFS family permease
MSVAAFKLLALAHGASQLGSQVTLIALPLTAITLLHAGPMEVGIVSAASTVPFLVLGLPVGVWVDRLPVRRLMVSADLLRFIALAVVPGAALAGHLRMWHLYVVALVAGVGTVFFDVSYQSFLPVIVGRGKIQGANSLMESIRITARISGPSLAGGLIQLVGAPFAITVDVGSYAVSAYLLGNIRAERSPSAPSAGLASSIGEGLRFVFENSVLRAFAVTIAVSNLFMGMLAATQLIFLNKDLGFGPGGIGLILSSGAVGSLLGAGFSGFFSRRLGLVRTTYLSALVTWPAWLLLPLARPGPGVAPFLAGTAIGSFGTAMCVVCQLSCRQMITPDHLLGRMNATMRFCGWGMLPFGGFVGGAIGQYAGVRTAVLISAAGCALASLPLVLSPVRRMPDPPKFASAKT